MSMSVAIQDEPAPVVACTVSRDVQSFDLLIGDMETELGERWGDLSFRDALGFLDQQEAEGLEFLAIALDSEDESRIDVVERLVEEARCRDIGVILITRDLSPTILHRLLRLGASDFLPYPLPKNALHEAIERLRSASLSEISPHGRPDSPNGGGAGHEAAVFAVHGLAGGVGTTTFAVNLAWELANQKKENGPRVCLLDLDLQMGSTATYLDLPRKELVYDLLSETHSMDNESFLQALQVYKQRLHVLTAPPDLLPLDFVNPDDIATLLGFARKNFDIVVIDMPTTLVGWTETVLHAASVYFGILELDMRSAQNTLRFVRLLKGEDLPVEKLRFVMNRAPKFTDLQGKSRVKRMADGLDIDIELMLPDGQKPVTQACDHGLPLSETAGRNPLRKEISKLAGSLHARVTQEMELRK